MRAGEGCPELSFQVKNPAIRPDGGVFVCSSVDLPRHDQKAAVRRVVGTGGQREQPVAGLDRDAGVIAPVLFDKRAVLRKLLRVRADAVIISKGVRALSGDFRFDRGHDLIRVGGVERVKLHDRVRSAKCRILVGDQGIGGKLLDFAVSRNCNSLWVLEKNTKAQHFYLRHGFTPSGVRQLEEGTEQFIIEMIR